MDEISILSNLRETMTLYYPLSDTTWNDLKKTCTIKEIKKSDYAFSIYDKVNEISYVYRGLFRAFAINEKGEEHTKNFFWETRFYGPMVSLLTGSEICSSVQAIENSVVVDIDYQKYRELLYKHEDLKMYHILYLEKHWILQKDHNTYALVLEDAKTRYERFLEEFGHIVHRVSQHHIASYLGISPTHLSRIKRQLH